jgi:hypothetical protein
VQNVSAHNVALRELKQIWYKIYGIINITYSNCGGKVSMLSLGWVHFGFKPKTIYIISQIVMVSK